jgi:uncharacterized membrane protein
VLFASVLLVATAVSWLAARRSGWRHHARRGMGVAMIVAGVAHLVGPDPFVQHLPEWVPAREPLVFASGLLEIALGGALLWARARRVAVGRALALYLLAVWPANIYVAAAGVDVEGQPDGPYPWIRLPLQLLFIAWALWSSRSVEPFRPEKSDLDDSLLSGGTSPTGREALAADNAGGEVFDRRRIVRR